MCNKMSDVRLSNASPTLERVDARQPDHARPPVCRNLFGAPDREETRRFLTEMLQEEQRDFAERYNFDPVSDTPLSPRNYSWEEVSDAPEYFSRPPHRRKRPHGDVDPRCENDERDAEEERNGRLSDPQQERNESKKRPTGAPGACSSESPSKRSRTNGGDDDDDDDDDDRSAGPGSQSLSVVKEKPSRLDNRAQV